MKKRIIMLFAGAALIAAIPAFAANGNNSYETYTGMSGGSRMQKISSAAQPGGTLDSDAGGFKAMTNQPSETASATYENNTGVSGTYHGTQNPATGTDPGAETTPGTGTNPETQTNPDTKATPGTNQGGDSGTGGSGGEMQ